MLEAIRLSTSRAAALARREADALGRGHDRGRGGRGRRWCRRAERTQCQCDAEHCEQRCSNHGHDQLTSTRATRIEAGEVRFRDRQEKRIPLRTLLVAVTMVHEHIVIAHRAACKRFGRTFEGQPCNHATEH